MNYPVLRTDDAYPDVPFARSESEYNWQERFHPIFEQIIRGEIRYNEAEEVDYEMTFTTFEQFYMCITFVGWIKDWNTEHRQRVRPDGVFLGWHNTEAHALGRQVKTLLYPPETRRWLEEVESPRLYKSLKPWVYIYYGSAVINGTPEVVRTLNAYGTCQYAELLILCIVQTAMHGTYRAHVRRSASASM